jgi:ankyrin repeat protein
MCAAYGVEPLALKLLQNGADPRTKNCYGYTPLLEACHRGFVNIVAMLLQFVGSVNTALYIYYNCRYL